MSPPVVLVIDPDPLARRICKATLRGRGYAVAEAADEAGAAASLERDRPALAVVSVSASDPDAGAGLAARLRSFPHNVALPIVCVWHDPAGGADGAEGVAHFGAVLRAPVEPWRMLRAVEALVDPAARPLPRAPRTVLVADDDPVQHKLLHLQLKRLGFEVVTAPNGAEALDCARRSRPAAIIADVLMPRLDGFRLCLAVRQEPALADVPVVLSSAAAPEELDLRLAQNVGATALVQRALDFRELAEALLLGLEERSAPALAAAPEDFSSEEHVFKIVRQLERQVVLLKRAEGENARLYREAQEAVHARDEFLSVASHELNTPLTSLHLRVQKLAGEARTRGDKTITGAELGASLEPVERQVQRLIKLISQLLDVSRIVSGHLEITREPVDLCAVVTDIAARFEQDLANAGSTLSLRSEGQVVGHWDRTRLEQIATNLLSNAIKYGAGQPVDVAVHADESRATLTVCDRGIGISPDQVARIFGRFERAVSSRNYGGLGLGLYIVRQIVEAHGGTITVASKPSSGSTFSVTLPRYAPPAVATASAPPPAPPQP